MDAVFFLIIRILMAAALYVFVGWAVYTIWRDLKRQGDLLETRLPSTINLRVSNGTPVSFTRQALTIGREPGCDLTIDDLTVSNQHARFTYHHQQWWLEDLGSKNGTFLNQEKISTPVVVTTGDQAQFGQVPVELEVG
jgi:pSer/pThr/pTyr-binding forkhead associated (FHA) protein